MSARRKARFSNCRAPAAVAARHIVGHLLPGVIFGALAPALPGRLLAGSADSIWISVWRGQLPAADEMFTFTLFQCGGAGARATKDGLSATGFPSGVAGVPAEVVEALAPLIQHRRELRCDSGGAGRQRGGLGQWSEISYRGAGSGASQRWWIERATRRRAWMAGSPERLAK